MKNNKKQINRLVYKYRGNCMKIHMGQSQKLQLICQPFINKEQHSN